jgi:hypothetical protein
MNYVLQRLGAILPDETLRQERQYVGQSSAVDRPAAHRGGYVACSRLPQWYFQGPWFLGHGDLLSSQIDIPVLGLEVSGFWLVWLMVCSSFSCRCP